MSSQLSLRAFRLAFGAFGIVAVVAQYVVFIDRGGKPVNVFSFDSLIDPPAEPLPFRIALRSLAFPLSYLPCSLVRDAIVQWYPYPFLSPASQGYEGVAPQSVIILAGGIALTWCIVTLPRLRSCMRHQERP